ncbi:unnamed protein product (macronuclear) [Paramecium tetraurelia]|uniref:Uncharacterized protein n=1 Tax=Paramecium tetraurelia TaxID=5888 RepID=A0BRG1_PARTE|nr:uncharacterized protein GSPATT00031359001 [Paramecium tetraurelia]CAK61128.1 unnamed protein product [Paramecium tetraurelia]|eukprot:XP_001428526.1 hypothetical protein (macronuclear) [Paramecium tetraurelia strain d4-2]
MNYQIKGNFNYHLEIQAAQLNETTNITINAFSSKINQIPLGCKFQWFKKSDNERIKIETQGNIYPCSIFDIGYKIEAIVQPFEQGYEGQATYRILKNSNFCLIRKQTLPIISQQYEINCNDQNWIFSLEYLENSTTQQKIQYSDQCILSNQNQLQVQFNNQIMKFKCKDDKDAFCAFFISMQSLRRVHLKFIAYNIGKLNQKQVNFQSLLNAQLLQLINEKSVMPIKKFEPIQNNVMMATSQDFRTNNQIQITQLKQEVAQLQSEKQKLQQQIDKLFKENKELEINSKSNTASRDQLDSMDRLIQSLKNEVYSLKQRETDLMNQNGRLTLALNEKNDKSLSQSQFLDEMKVKQYQDMLLECNNEKVRLQEELNKYQKFGSSSRTSQNIDGEKERLLQVNQKLMQEIATSTNKIKELQLELEMMKNMSRISMSMSMIEDPVMKTKIEQLEQENQYLQKKISILEEELSKKKQPKPQKQQPDRDLQIQKLTEANKRYLEENLKLFEEIRQLREKFDYSSVLQNSMKDSQIQENVVNHQLEQQIERMQQIHNLEIQKMKKKIEKLTNDLQDANQVKKQFEQLIKQNKRLVEENMHLTEQIKNLADINLSKSFSDNMFNSKIFNSDQYKELEQQLVVLKRKNEEIQSKLDIQLQRDTQQQDKIKQLEQEIAKYKNQIREIEYNNSVSNEVKLLQNQIDDYQKAKDNLMRENIQLRDDYATLLQDKEYLNGKIKQLENSIFELKQKQMQLQEENRTLKLFPQSAERQFSVQIQQLQLQNKNLTEEIVRLQSQQNAFKDLNQSNLSISESVLGSKIYDAKEYKLLENQKELLFTENQQLKLEIRSEYQKSEDQIKFQEQIKALQNERDILNQQLISNKEQHSRQIITLQNQIDKLNQQLQNVSLSESRYRVIINDNKVDDYAQKQQDILRLENENKQLNVQIQKLQLQYDTEIRRQQTQLSDLQFENNKLSREVTYSKQYSESVVFNQTEKKQYSSQESEIVQLKNQLADKTHQLKVIQTNSQNSMEELQQVISKLGLENKNMNEVHNSIKSRLEAQVNKLVEQLREKDQNINKIQDELRRKEQIAKQQEDDLFIKSNQVEQLIQQNKGLALQLNNLNFELQELRMASLSHSFSKSHIDVRENENQELQSEIQILRNQIQTLESQSTKQLDNSKLIKLEDEIVHYQREISLIKNKLQITLEDSEFYKREFTQSQQQIEKMRKELSQKQSEKLSTQENELVQIKRTNQQLIQENSDQSITIQNQQQQIDELQQDLNEYIESNQTITKLKMQLQLEGEKLQRENQQLIIKIQELSSQKQMGRDQELNELIRKLQSMEQDKAKLIISCEQQQQLIDNLKSTLEISQNKKDEFEIKLHSTEQYKQELQISLKEQDQKIKQLQQESYYLSKELDTEQQKHTTQKKKVNELTVQIQNKDNELQQQINKLKNLEEQILKKDQQISTLNNQISQLKQENNKYTNEIIPKLNQQIDQETLEKNQLHKSLQEQFVQMEQQILSMTREKSPLKSKSNSQCKPFDQSLNEKITQQEQIINQKNQIIEQQLEKLKILTQQNNGLLHQINKLNDDLRDLQDKSFSLDRSSETYLINKSFNSKYNADNDLILQHQYQSQDIYESDRKRQSQYQQFEQTLQESVQENKSLKLEIDQLKQFIQQQKNDYEKQIQNMSTSNSLQIQELNTKLEKLSQEEKKHQNMPSQNLRNEYQQQIDRLEEELLRKQGVEQSNQRLNNEIKIQITKVVELQQQLEGLRQQNQQLSNQIKEQEELIRSLQKMKIQNSDSSEAQKEGELNQLTQQLQNETLILKGQNQKYQQQISEYQSKIETLENEIQKKSQQISLKDSQVNQNNRKTKKLEEQIQLLQDQLKGQGGLVTQNKDEVIVQLQNELEQKRTEMFEFQKQIKQLDEQIDRLTKSNSALMEENCRLNDQLKDNLNVSYLSNDSQNH